MAGHRLLLVHLFLPDTAQFYEEEAQTANDASPQQMAQASSAALDVAIDDDDDDDDDDDAKAPRDRQGATARRPQPHSPAEHHNDLPIHELSSRLQGATTSNDVAVSDQDGPVVPPIRPHPRRLAPHATRSARSSFSEATKSINMSTLMAEATMAPASSIESMELPRVSSPSSLVPPRLRRDSPNSSAPTQRGLTAPVDQTAAHHHHHHRVPEHSDSDPLPIAVGSDHGRGAAGAAAGLARSSAAHGPSGSTPFAPALQMTSAAPGITTQTISQGTSAAAGQQRARRASGGAASMAAPLAPGPRRPPEPDGSGTRTPGANLGGKAGTMVPLSIIGDLAAKQSMLQPQARSTPGDSERHHPFGSGAVTPMRGTQTPGHSVRTPGASMPQPRAVLNRPPMSHLTMTSVKDSSSPRDAGASGTRSAGAAGASSTLASAAATGLGTSLGHPPGGQGKRPPLGPSRLSAGRVTSAVASGSVNDHGRGAAVESPVALASPRELPPSSSIESVPSSASNPAADTSAGSAASTAQAAAAPGHARRQQSFSGRHARASSNNSSGPPAAPSSSWNRSSKSRGARSSLRRQSSLVRSLGRRASNASLDTFDDGFPEGGTESPPNLPPFEFVASPSANGGLVHAVDSVGRERLRAGKVWIGTPGLSIDDWMGPAEKRALAQRFRDERSCVPVWVEDELFLAHYNHFCKQILWPTFHYTLPTQKGLENEHEAFLAYKEVNRRFADAIVREYREGDIVWINDYHLLLVPQMVRDRVPHATIGFFLHIAFPSSEIFRCLAIREDILRGMLGADLIGFQTTNFCRHFRQTVSRILQLEATPKGIQLDGRHDRRGFVAVNPFPIGIDVRGLNLKRADPEVAEWVGKLRERYEGKKIIVGRDKLDWIKGVRQKLLAFELFLEEHPEWVGKAVLIQVALATTEENEEIGAATDVVARINNKFSSLTYQPVVFLHVQDITFSQYLALLTIADAFLACSLREGMNLTSHEYVVCQETKHRPLILSEFTGTYSALRACIGINPLNTKQVAHAIYKAVSMDDQEAFARWNDLHRAVVTQTSQHWTTSLLSKLERAHLEQERRDNSFIPRLEIGQLVSEWRASKLRLLLLDLEDTLIDNDEAGRNGALRLPDETLQLLRDLCADQKNRVYVLSGHSARELDGIRVPGLGKIAENGCAIRYAGDYAATDDASAGADRAGGATAAADDDGEGDGEGKAEWVSLVAGINMSWREPVRELLQYFTERTPGSRMEDRGSTFLWRFWNSTDASKSPPHARAQEMQWARRQSAEVQNLIYDSLGERFSLRIIPGSTSFLILPKGVSRATAVQHLISLSSMGALRPRSARESVGSFSFQVPSFSVGAAAAAAVTPETAANGSRDLAQAYMQPSNAFGPITSTAAHASTSPSMSPSSGALNSGSALARTRTAYGAKGVAAGGGGGGGGGGSFDFVLGMSQDDALLSYVNGLDLPFAPITCTTGMAKGRGGEAGVYLEGPDEAREALREMLRWRSMDARWGPPSMADI